MDRSSLAAELLSVMINTSNYTFEAAPPVAVIELSVLESTAKLLGWDFKGCSGLMIPGGR